MAVPISDKRKVLKIGASYCVSLPKEWFEAHGIDPEREDLKLLILANKDIRIVNPEHEAEVYKEFAKIVRKVEL